MHVQTLVPPLLHLHQALINLQPGHRCAQALRNFR